MARDQNRGEKSAIFGIVTARDFLDKLEADFIDFEREPGSGRLALNCALTAYHMHEWVWGDWLKKSSPVRTALGIGKGKGDFLAWIDRHCIWFLWIQGLANGTKHTTPQSFQALRVSRLPFSFDAPGAGWDEGAWDGPMPFVVGGDVLLLIDNGPDAGEHRWMPVGMLLNAVVRFWRQFFAQYAPPPQNAGIADWRL